MTPSPVSRRVAYSYMVLVALLALTGVMQMPIASRYRITTVPYLGWLGDFWLTHKLHAAGAVGLLFLCGYVATRWLLEWRRDHALSAFGWARATVVLCIIVTGGLRVLKNLPSVSFPPHPTMLLDWTHLGLPVLLGGLALLRRALHGANWRAGSSIVGDFSRGDTPRGDTPHGDTPRPF